MYMDKIKAEGEPITMGSAEISRHPLVVALGVALLIVAVPLLAVRLLGMLLLRDCQRMLSLAGDCGQAVVEATRHR